MRGFDPETGGCGFTQILEERHRDRNAQKVRERCQIAPDVTTQLIIAGGRAADRGAVRPGDVIVGGGVFRTGIGDQHAGAVIAVRCPQHAGAQLFVVIGREVVVEVIGLIGRVVQVTVFFGPFTAEAEGKRVIGRHVHHRANPAQVVFAVGQLHLARVVEFRLCRSQVDRACQCGTARQGGLRSAINLKLLHVEHAGCAAAGGFHRLLHTIDVVRGQRGAKGAGCLTFGVYAAQNETGFVLMWGAGVGNPGKDIFEIRRGGGIQIIAAHNRNRGGAVSQRVCRTVAVKHDFAQFKGGGVFAVGLVLCKRCGHCQHRCPARKRGNQKGSFHFAIPLVLVELAL